jgi:ABC-2 type transport system ATP-binding protein
MSDAMPLPPPPPTPSDPGSAPGAPALPPPPPSAMPAPVAGIELDHVSRWYGNVVAVNDISFALGPGVTGLLGPNGAGKTTILHVAAGLLAPSTGHARIGGETAWRNPAIYRRLGLVPEREAVPAHLTGRQYVELNARLHRLADPRAASARALATVDLEAAADRAIGTYSKGMQQRAKIAGSLVHDPPMLLLDEPFNGMDPRQRLHMIDLLRSMADEGRTILFSSHILEEVERLADSILVIFAGRLAASGDFRQLRRLMTDRPRTVLIHSADDRRLASALLPDPSVAGVEIGTAGLVIRISDGDRFARLLPRAARDAGVSLHEVLPTDDSLERVFAYLVTR